MGIIIGILLTTFTFLWFNYNAVLLKVPKLKHHTTLFIDIDDVLKGGDTYDNADNL